MKRERDPGGRGEKEVVTVAPDTVVTFEFVLTDGFGRVIDRTGPDEAVMYLHGHGQIIPGLEKALAGKRPGSRFRVAIDPKDAYGEKIKDKKRRQELTVTIERHDLEPVRAKFFPGMEIRGTDSKGKEHLFFVQTADKLQVTLTPEHPLAGVRLHFDVIVGEVRPASKAEIADGEPYGGGSAVSPADEKR